MDNSHSQILVLGDAHPDAPVCGWPLVESPKPQAGFPSPAADYLEATIDLNELMVRNPPATFFARVSGESLSGLGVLPGDIVAVDRSLTAAIGDVVVAVFQGDCYVKVFGRCRGRPALLSKHEDPGRFPVLFLDEDEDHIIWGVVTGLVRGMRHRV